ncbi:MAG: hypothetical protein ACRDCE_13235 [Cetobacterium sp.]|uniref:hypothetical protein n=1 Tax=Cetobacterium TaxID=180162 RepID=UPI001F0539E3|nr:hypothetical protein [Cetobacterium somerae]UPO97016.1 hypothetical protein MKD34_07675 [Cetobacterium somerae]
MKNFLMLLTIIGAVAYGAEYRNGTYRGVYISGQETQVEVQFDLKDDKVEKPKFRTLFYKDQDYLKNKDLSKYKAEYEALLTAIINKNVNDGMETLYAPGEIENAGATVRATKVRAAIKNALNSGVYTPAK